MVQWVGACLTSTGTLVWVPKPINQMWWPMSVILALLWQDWRQTQKPMGQLVWYIQQ